MRFVTDNEIRSSVHDVFDGSAEIGVAVAFWGRGAAERLLSRTDPATQRVRVICELEMGGSNPATIRRLLASSYPGGLEIAHVPGLHAKVYLGETGFVCGSANASVNGLGLEESEVLGWHEAALYCEDEQELRNVWRWFEQLWACAQPIDEYVLEAAERRWRNRRVWRRPLPKSGSLLEAVRHRPEALADQLWFVVLPANTEGHGELDTKVDHMNAEATQGHEFWYYCGWPALTRDLPEGAHVVNLAYHDNGGLDHNDCALYQLIGPSFGYTSDGYDYRIVRLVDPETPTLPRHDRETFNKLALRRAIRAAAYQGTTLWHEEAGVLTALEMNELLHAHESASEDAPRDRQA